MASRALGAMLALAAAILFVASLVSPVITTGLPAWWDGHPIVDGKERVIQDVHVGPFGAKGCNERGCAALDGISDPFQIISYAEGGIVALAAGVSFLLALAAWRGTDRRKAVAVFALLVAIVCVGGAVVLMWQGLEIQAGQQHIEIPIGTGFFLFAGGVIAMGIASVATLASKPEPLRLKTRTLPEPPPDLRQIVRDQHDSLRPAALGPEPTMGAKAQSAGAQPLFEAAPQLRPLYEMPGGAVPHKPQLDLPTRAPTPIPRASISAIAGIPTPLPFDAPPTPSPDAPRGSPRPNPPTSPQRAKPTTNPPRAEPESIPPKPTTNPRAKPESIPPKPTTNPPRAKPESIPLKPTTNPRAKPESIPPKPTTNPPRAKPESNLPPETNPPRAKPESNLPPETNPPRAKPASAPPSSPPLRGKGPTVPPPARPGASVPPPGARRTPVAGEEKLKREMPTIAVAVAPPPEQAPSRASAPRLDSESEITGVEEIPLKGPVTAVEIDAAGKAAAKAAEAKRHSGQAARVAAEEEQRRRAADAVRIVEAKRREAEQRAAQDEALAKRRAARLLTGDTSDTNTDAQIGERRSEIVLGTDEERALANDEISTPRESPGDVEGDGVDTRDIQNQERYEAVRLGMRRAPSATPIDPLAVVRPATDPVIEQPPPSVLVVEQPRPTPVPISTAAKSLPPPKKTEPVTSGPTPACPQCESPMAWVEEHLRFYCKSCRMYF